MELIQEHLEDIRLGIFGPRSTQERALMFMMEGVTERTYASYFAAPLRLAALATVGPPLV